MLLLTKSDMKQVLSMRDAIESNKLAFRLMAEQSCKVPLRTSIQAINDRGVFLFMPAYDQSLHYASLKIVNIFLGNIEKGKATSTGQVLLMNDETGEVLALMDGTYLTQIRTGAASGAAFDLLAKADVATGTLIGTGGQAASQLEAMLTARALVEVKVFDTDTDRLHAFVSKMNEQFASSKTKITAAASSDDAIRDADLITTVTTSVQPVFHADCVKEGAVVSCVGSYLPHMQEMDPALLRRASKIYFDDLDTVMEESGDIMIPMKNGAITKDSFTGNLGDVVAGKLPGRENDHELIVFKTVGLGIQDLTAAKFFYEKAKKLGVGTVWDSDK